MQLVFAGTPEFAAVALQALIEAGHEVVAVLTQPDRPAGRGMKLQPSPVKLLALERGIPVWQPRSLRLDGKFAGEAQAAQAQLATVFPRAQAMVVAAYGLILPQWVLDLPPLGCLNIHASLLPRWRGAAPIHRAIEAGDTRTGVTIMQMDAGLDTGDMLNEGALDIAPTDTTASLHDRLATLGGQLIVQALATLSELPRRRQPDTGVTYARKIDKGEALLDWTLPADVLARRVRAFDPFPAAQCLAGTEVIKVWAAHVVERAGVDTRAPGEVLRADAQGVEVACGQGSLCLTQLQRAGGRRLPAADFLRGHPLAVGQVLQGACAGDPPCS